MVHELRDQNTTTSTNFNFINPGVNRLVLLAQRSIAGRLGLWMGHDRRPRGTPQQSADWGRPLGPRFRARDLCQVSDRVTGDPRRRKGAHRNDNTIQ